MAVKPTNVEKPKSKIEPFLPVLIIFGPMFMLMGLHAGLVTAVRRPDWLDYFTALAGAFMLIFGLVLLKLRQDSLEKRLDEMERLKN